MDLQLARDTGLILDAGAAAITTTAAGSVAYVDLGANWASYPLIVVQLNVSAIVVNDNDETYAPTIQTSDSTAFTVVRGTAGILLRAVDSTAVVGTYFISVIPAGRYIRLLQTNGGNTPSITYGGKVYLNTFPGS